MNFFESLESIRIGEISLSTILSAILILIVCVIVRKILMKIFNRVMEKSRIDGSVKTFLRSAVNIVLWILVILIVADNLGIPMTSLVAVVSVAGLALSLSVQNILSNIFSGMTILATQPFKAGDLVDIGGTVGVVTAVNLFYTTLTTADGRVIHIPNSTVSGAKIEDCSTNPLRRVDITVTASYEDSAETVKKALLDAAANTELVLSDPEPVAVVAAYGESSISYTVMAWTKSADFLGAKARLTENIRTSFAASGVTMTYNHLNVHVIEK